MLYDPARHEPLQTATWDEARVRDCISRIVRDTEQRFSPGRLWPLHPQDADPAEHPATVHPSLYFGACGVVWALRYLQAVGAVQLENEAQLPDTATLLSLTRAWLKDDADKEQASFMMGETPIHLLEYGLRPDAATADRLAALIEGNLDHPARELMWGSPGTLLAALFLHQRTGEGRWAHLFKQTAAKLWSQLLWSEEHQCHYWTQDLYGQTSSYIDAVHGFVATALPLIRGRHLLHAADWRAWQACIANTMQRTATWEGTQVNWMPWLLRSAEQTERWNKAPRWLMQYCHGAPGFVICLADFPGTELDDLLLAAGEATWTAGPLVKGSNLCHGTGGNGYAFLKLHQRTGDHVWLQRARAFAMHGIAQTDAHAAQYGQMRYSLWTGDPGFAVYLWDCLRGEAAFPTLDAFYAG